MAPWHTYNDANHVYENEDAVAVLDGREILGEWVLTHPTRGQAMIRLWENGEDVHVWHGEGVGFDHCPDQADSYPGGWAYIRDELLPELVGEGYAVDAALVSESLTDEQPTIIGAGSPETSALTHCPECGSAEWLDDGRRGWNAVDVECEVCAGTYDDGPDDTDEPVIAEPTPWWELSGIERAIAKYKQCEEPGDCDHDHDDAIEYFREQELNGLRERAEKAEAKAADLNAMLALYVTRFGNHVFSQADMARAGVLLMTDAELAELAQSSVHSEGSDDA